FYPSLSPEELTLTLVHPAEVILPELSGGLGSYAQRKLEQRGVRVWPHARVSSYDGEAVQLADGREIPTKTLLWTAGTMPHPLIGTLPCARSRGRIVATPELAVPDWPGVWALGDCASVPDLTTNGFCPPTAQHGLRQGQISA